MKKLFIFTGKSGSGKSTLISRLVEKAPHEFSKIITCTSRSARVGEVDGVDYFFMPKSYFLNNNNLVLVKEYENGSCYGTRKSDLLTQDRHLLLASKPTAILKLTNLGITNIIVINLLIEKTLQEQRLLGRGDKKEVIRERLRLEKEEEKEGVLKIQKVPVINLDASKPIKDKVATILRHA